MNIVKNIVKILYNSNDTVYQSKYELSAYYDSSTDYRRFSDFLIYAIFL